MNLNVDFWYTWFFMFSWSLSTSSPEYAFLMSIKDSAFWAAGIY
jgi:hypothetical protein